MISYVIAGLGNPGSTYACTRHNIGFSVADALVLFLKCSWKHESKFKAEIAKTNHDGKEIILTKPQTYMNCSGEALQPLCSYYKIPAEKLIVIYDDIAFGPGQVKISVNGSAGGHNGIRSILEHLGDGFIRYRIGIGSKPHPEMDLKDYVLGKWNDEEQRIFQDKMPFLVSGLLSIIDNGSAYAMNRINQRTKTHDNEKL